MESLRLDLFADHFQFYLRDDSPEAGDLSEAWHDEGAFERMMAVNEGVVGIGTWRNFTVPVTLDVLPEEPASDVADWEHVVEADLAVGSGRFVIAGCTDYLPEARRIAVEPGLYRVRMSCRGFATVAENCLDGEDHYRVEVWPAAEAKPPRVLKLQPRD